MSLYTMRDEPATPGLRRDPRRRLVIRRLHSGYTVATPRAPARRPSNTAVGDSATFITPARCPLKVSNASSMSSNPTSHPDLPRKRCPTPENA